MGQFSRIFIVPISPTFCGQYITTETDSCYSLLFILVMPPTLKKLMGHIAFGASVSGCVGAWVTLFVPTVTFKPLKLES